MSISLSEAAAKEIKSIIKDQGLAESVALRVGVKGGGCSGLTYILGFDKFQENDEQYESDGLSYIMNPAHGIYLTGMEIHWENGLNARGFTFKNPNASKTCGCGTSFAV